ncbi:oxepin-CoA hydrolase, alternative type [Denitrobaculum tricleocarpae]|uniref:Enoyl-CoA hydratase n=1 Tax=Denitrobaculum tricleocarpae TaxID=2591009 RepID=A0A545U127_9PROT|nr:enoyl-CoA hydratase [Denitrobaculum tricleocarpae]TQV83158.1 enoyl-CoA hydratase [Denitrobaculum tricleocarpae]
MIETRKEGAVLIVVNSDPGTRNALTPEFYRGFRELLEDAGGDTSVAAIVLTGAGDFFCSGGNLTVLKERTTMKESERRQGIDKLHSLITAMRACPKPIVAAIEGGAAGAGVSMALACDMVVAARDAYFSVAYVKIGLTPDGGATAFLSRSLPRQLVSELCLTGDRVGVQRLYDLGTINRIVETGQAVDEATAIAQRLAQGPEGAMARIKHLVDSGATTTLDEQLELEAQSMAASFGTAEGAEGIAAFLEKRKPRFRPMADDEAGDPT